MSATDSYSTKNTKGNRKVVTADYNFPKAIFKIPDGLDLQDKKVVKAWFVKGMYLNIRYVDGREEVIEWEWDPTEERADWQYPDEQIEDAEDWECEYSDDEEESEIYALDGDDLEHFVRNVMGRSPDEVAATASRIKLALGIN